MKDRRVQTQDRRNYRIRHKFPYWGHDNGLIIMDRRRVPDRRTNTIQTVEIVEELVISS